MAFTISGRCASGVFTPTPSDTEDLERVTEGISFAGAGALAVILVGMDEAVTIPSGNLVPGMIHPLHVKRLLSTGTTATGIRCWY